MKFTKYILPAGMCVAAMLSLLPSCKNANEIQPINIETSEILGQLRNRDIQKWTEEKRLQKEQDESDAAFNERVKKMYDAYWSALREYKKSDHKIVYGWFSGWTATKGVERSFLSNLPDSVDIVSIWGGTTPFDESDPRWADLKYAQEVKGLRVLLCWQTGSSGLGLPGGVEEFDKRHEGKSSTEKAIAYAQELTDFIKKHNLNGYDIDWEPNVGDHGWGCQNLYHNCVGAGSDEAPMRAFITELGKNFGPKQESDYNPRGTGTLLLFDGEIRNFANRAGDLGDYFDYFLNQNYYHVTPNHEFSDVSRIKGFTWKKYVGCDEFEKNAKDGGTCGTQGSLSCAERKARIIAQNNYGGWGAYHIELEHAYGYRNVRKVAQIMNPSELFVPDENLINSLTRK